jgi:hypothetical protein
MTTNYTKWQYNVRNDCKVLQMVIKYANIFLSKALLNTPKLEFLVRKVNHLATLLDRSRCRLKSRTSSKERTLN